MFYKWSLTLFSVVTLFGCASIKQPDYTSTSASDEFAACYRAYQSAENLIRKESHVSAHTQPLYGYPFFRTNRFLSEIGQRASEATEISQWLSLMNKLATDAIENETKTLSRKLQENISVERLHACAPIILDQYLEKPDAIKDIRSKAVAKDEYHEMNKILGLYPLSAVPMRMGVKRWHKEALSTFSTAPKPDYEWVSYLTKAKPLTHAQVEKILDRSTKAPLEIPIPSPKDASRLAEQFAPIWRVDTKTNDDVIGRPEINANGATINTLEQEVYWYLSHSIFEGQVLLQLNYVIWLPSRPKTNLLDPLGGPIDGLHWRVTLSRDGTPLIYDSIHNCGCYHMFFPSKKLKKHFDAHLYQEPILIPKSMEKVKPNEKIALYLEAQTHYLIGVEKEKPAYKGHHMKLRPYHKLEAIPVTSRANTHQNLFDHDGLINESARLERFLFWPMGVPAAGSMRQRGTHATAFIGERHFDDATLFETLFRSNNHR